MSVRFAKEFEHFINIDEVVLDPRNAKIHTEKHVNQLARIIETDGFNEAITLGTVNGKDEIIICGNGRVMAMRLLGEKTIPYIKLDFRNEAQRIVYGLKNNAIQQETGFHKQVVLDSYEIIKLEPIELAILQEVDIQVLEPLKIDAVNLALDNPEAFYEKLEAKNKEERE